MLTVYSPFNTMKNRRFYESLNSAESLVSTLLNEFIGGFDTERDVVLSYKKEAYATSQDENAYSLRVEVPGVKPETIEVSGLDNRLVIKYVSRDKAQRTEFTVPNEYNVAAATASCELGVLTVTVPRSAATTEKKIAVEIK